MNKKPNLLLFIPDTFRADALHHLGSEASVTPNFDKMALDDGVSFANAYCQNPICTPSRCSFMSGLYPHVNGHRTLTNMMEYHEPVLLEILKREGYHVWWGGKDDLIPAENDHTRYCSERHSEKRHKVENLHSNQDWRTNFDSNEYYSFQAGKLEPTVDDVFYDCDWSVIYGCKEFLENYSEDKPVCLFLPLLYPHPPYGVEEPWYSMINRELIDMPQKAPDNWDLKPGMLKGIYEKQRLQGLTDDQWREIKAVYLGMCARLDSQFGMLVDILKNKGMYDDTAIFMFSDHGDFTGDYGLVEKTQNTFEDCLTRVPLIIKPPSGFEVKSGIHDAMVELVDIVPTVCHYAGIEMDYDQFGMSLADCVAGKKDEHRDAVFCEGGRRHGEVQCMERADNALTEPTALYWPKIETQQSEGPEHTKAVMCRTKEYKYVYRMYETDEFYDLVNDPKEMNNLILHPDYQSLILQFKERTLRFMVETCDTVPRVENKRW